MNILIIEDDILLANRIGKLFERTVISNRVKVIHSFREFLNELSIIDSYDIVLTDLKLSGNRDSFDGYDIIEIIREKNLNLPVVVISWFSDVGSLQKAFQLWASDYIIKPFRLKELEVRILNWFKNFYLTWIYFSWNTISYKELVYKIDTNEFYYNNELIPLTKKNKYILSLFFSKPDKLLSETYLIEKIWWDIMLIVDRNLRVNILRLKQSLNPYGLDERIKNIRGEGYIFSAKRKV